MRKKYILKLIDRVHLSLNNRETGRFVLDAVIFPLLDEYKHLIIDLIGCENMSNSCLDEIFGGISRSVNHDNIITVISPLSKTLNFVKRYNASTILLKAGGHHIMKDVKQVFQHLIDIGVSYGIDTNVMEIFKSDDKGKFLKLTNETHRIKCKMHKKYKKKFGEESNPNIAITHEMIRYKLINNDEMRELYNELSITDEYGVNE